MHVNLCMIETALGNLKFIVLENTHFSTRVSTQKGKGGKPKPTSIWERMCLFVMYTKVLIRLVVALVMHNF